MTQNSHLNLERIGAVEYLNMFPFFAFHAGIKRFSSPRLLNEAAKACSVDAACMSAIAGIRAGFEPLEPFLGVGAHAEVGSVFIEPLDNFCFWEEFIGENKGRFTGDNFQFPSLKPKTVHLFSNGASEQSEWLIKVLLRAQGFDCSVHYFHASEDRRSAYNAYRSKSNPTEPCAHLIIGDEALMRSFDETKKEPLLDLAILWRDFSSLPCIFAVWYSSAPAQSKEIGAFLFENAKRWINSTDEEKKILIDHYLQTTRSALSQPVDSSSFNKKLDNYLAKLSFILDKECKETFRFYRSLAQKFCEASADIGLR